MTKKQKQIYEFIKNFIQENKFAPTIREIGTAVGLKSTSSVARHLKNLEAKGYITSKQCEPRTIVVTETKIVFHCDKDVSG